MKKILTLLAAAFLGLNLAAQVFTDASAFPVYGKASDATKTRYQRLPAALEGVSRGPVWYLGTQSAGLYVRFRSNSTAIHARWTSTYGSWLSNMNPTGVRGLDLYILVDGVWRPAGVGRPSQEKTSTDCLVKNMTPEWREYMLYLSLYDGVDSLEIGVDEGASLEQPVARTPRTDRPVVMYGTSILQGCSASRPGMAHTNMIARALDREVINLGFSGNALLDPEIARLMASVPDPSVYVLDYAPNAYAPMIKEHGEEFFRILRDAHPDVPVIFIEDVIFPHTLFDSAIRKEVEDKNFEQKALFERLKSQGEKLIFYIPAWAMTMPDGETTADTIHLTDLGMQRYVDLVLPVIREALRLSGQVPAPEQAIGVFDSGTGGLTVLEKLLELDAFDNGTGAERADGVPDLGKEKFQYLADQANMPYGTYDAAGKADYLRQLVVADADFLMGDRYSRDAAEKEPSGWKSRCKILVIGCNTATAYGLDLVRKKLDEAGDGVKVIGVIEAGSKAALKALADEEQPFAIGVLATQGTISSGAYERTLKALAAGQGVEGRMTVVSQSGYGFAEAVDGEPDFVDVRLKAPRASYRGPRIGTGDADIKAYLLPVYRFETKKHALLGSKDGIQLNAAANYARFNLVSLVERHRLSGSTVPLKAVILGCTHYPFHLETMQKVVRELREYRENGRYPYRDLLAEDLVFIDPAHDTAVECYRLLREDGLLAEEGTAAVDAFISVPAAEIDPACLTPDGKLTYEFKYGRNPGDDPCTRPVPFSRSNLDPENLARIRVMLPRSYSLIEPGL